MIFAALFKYAGDTEPEFDENEEVKTPGARDLAERIAKLLAEKVASISKIEQRSFYGWEFSTEYEGYSILNVLNPVEGDAYLSIDLKAGFLKRLFDKNLNPAFERYREITEECLKRIQEISEIKWEKK